MTKALHVDSSYKLNPFSGYSVGLKLSEGANEFTGLPWKQVSGYTVTQHYLII